MALPSIPRLMRFFPADPCYGLGAAALILLAISGGAWQRALEHPALRWCGRVSYSLYLTHNIVLLAVVQLLHGELAPVPLVLAVIAASLVVAGGFHALVEVPAILLGRRIGAGPRPALVVAR
jgi:peptidoglycan/LPS O-acetylase OafA/YrhL